MAPSSQGGMLRLIRPLVKGREVPLLLLLLLFLSIPLALFMLLAGSPRSLQAAGALAAAESSESMFEVAKELRLQREKVEDLVGGLSTSLTHFCRWPYGRRRYGFTEGPCRVCDFTEEEVLSALDMPGRSCKGLPQPTAFNLYIEGEWTSSTAASDRYRKAPRGRPMCGMFCITLKRSNGWRSYLIPAHMRPGTSDFDVARQVLGEGFYRSLEPSYGFSTILDAGANVGFASVFFSLMYPHARIISIEPSDDNFKTLELNTRHLPNVEVLHAALWSSTQQLSVVQNSNPGVFHEEWAFLVKESSKVDKTDEVIATTSGVSVAFIQDLLMIENFDLLKVDIEGSESEVFSGRGDGFDFLNRGRMAIMEVHDWIRPNSSDIVKRAFLSKRWKYDGEDGEHTLFSKM